MALRIPLVYGDGAQGMEELPDGDNISASAVFDVMVVTTSPYTIVDEAVLIADAQAFGADMTINLPTAASRFTTGFTELVFFKNSSITGNRKVIVTADGAEKIDGSTTPVSLSKFNSLTIVSDGANWWIV